MRNIWADEEQDPRRPRRRGTNKQYEEGRTVVGPLVASSRENLYFMLGKRREESGDSCHLFHQLKTCNCALGGGLFFGTALGNYWKGHGCLTVALEVFFQ